MKKKIVAERKFIGYILVQDNVEPKDITTLITGIFGKNEITKKK